MTNVTEIAEFMDDQLDRYDLNEYRQRVDRLSLLIRELISAGYIGTRTLWGVQVYTGNQWRDHGAFFALRVQAENERRRILARKWYRPHEIRLVTTRITAPQPVKE